MKKITIAISIIVLVLGFIVGSAIWETRAAKKLIEERRHNIAGLALEIGGYEFSLYRAKLKLKDIKIYPTGKEEEKFLLASTDELSVNIAPLDLFRGTLHARKIKLNDPKINYIVTRKKVSNWSTLQLNNDDKTNEAPLKNADLKPWLIVIDEVEIENGDVSYLNEMNGQYLELRSVDVLIKDIRKAAKPDELPTLFEMKADIGKTGGKILVKGIGDVINDNISFELTGNLSNTPITAFSSFYIDALSFPIVAGTISATSNAKAVKNILRSSHHATITGLKTGGIKGEVINKFLLLQPNPIGINATVNGDLSTGNFSFSSAISKSLTNELLKHVAKAAQAPIKSLSIGEKIKNWFR